MVVQMPGWTGLANARVTIFGDVYQLPAEMQAAAREVSRAHHCCAACTMGMQLNGPFSQGQAFGLCLNNTSCKLHISSP